MLIAVALLAATAADAGGPVAPPPAQLSYRFAVLDVAGLGWRAEHHASLTAVRSGGGTTVWTAPRAVAERLREAKHRTIAAPVVTAFENAPVHVNTRPGARGADDRFAVREGVTLTAIGRAIDQGILMRVVLDETRLDAVHDVPGGVAAGCCPADADCRGAVAVVPEVSSCQVAGEWVVPADGVLLVSLGAYTVAGEGGKAEVRERLAILEAQRTAPQVSGDVTRASYVPIPVPTTIPLPTPIPATPAPSLPSRTLPQAHDPDGNVRPIEPPLPALPPPTRKGDSEEPCATPQAHAVTPTHIHKMAGALTAKVDADATRTSATVSRPTGSWEPAGTRRTIRFRLPNGLVTIEVRADEGDDHAPPPPKVAH